MVMKKTDWYTKDCSVVSEEGIFTQTIGHKKSP